MESILSSPNGGWIGLLEHACTYDMIELFDVCIFRLEENSNIEVILREGINQAVSNHSINVFKKVLSLNIGIPNIDIQVHNHELILHVVANGTYEMVQAMLLDPRCDPSTPNNIDSGSNSALWIACSKDDLNVFKLLLTDPRVDITDYNYGIIDCAKDEDAWNILDFLSTHPLTMHRL
jgi:hypothetical protein